MGGVLLLNATYEPLRVITQRRAVQLLLEGKADAISSTNDRTFRSERELVDVPTVVKLRYFVKVPYSSRLPLNRRTLTARDAGVCQYAHCGRKGDTIDHVHPRAKGGQHRWDNVVLCCRACNQKKGDRTLEQMGWRLRRQPEAPASPRFLVIPERKLHSDWEPWLQLESELGLLAA